jgi:16S rRNA (cytidine1402-2'-O)-methyltransferase
MSGKLYVCATPIGNLQDVTLRLLSVLAVVHVIAAEDTRHTRKLLSHHGLPRPLVSYHEHNKAQAGEALIQRLLAGEDVALVTDAGVPAVSDPGGDLVARAAALGITVIPVPGPSALTAALSVSGLDAQEFTFVGFLPRSARRLAKLLDELCQQHRALVAYESPKRLMSTLNVMADRLGDRRIFIARELTKVHEEVFRGTTSMARDFFSGRDVLGEITIVLEGAHRDASGRDSAGRKEAPGEAPQTAGATHQAPHDAVDEVMRRVAGGEPLNEAVREVAVKTGARRNELYRMALERKINQ